MPKIIYAANWDWVLYRFRRALATLLREQGYEVTLVCPPGKYVETLRDGEGFRWVEWQMSRRSLNPFRELESIRQLARIYRREDPDIIHHDTIKPNLYGTLASLLNRPRSREGFRPTILNAFMGIGFLFSERLRASLLRPIVLPVMRLAFKQSHVYTTFSNESDRERFLQLGLVERKHTHLMISEFVDTTQFRPASESRTMTDDGSDELRVLMAARLLWDKGVKEFVGAAEKLAAKNLRVRMCLAGEPDLASPGSVPVSQLRDWNSAGVVNWLGHRMDMPDLLRNVDVAVLPTHYNEGLPRFLVEAAATGLPLIATDMPACRQVVRHGENGFVVPTRDPDALANAIASLVGNPNLRTALGNASRQLALEEFAESEVSRAWMRLYEGLLKERDGAAESTHVA